MSVLKSTRAPKRATNVSIRRDLLAEAKGLGVNLSQAAEYGIAQTIKAKREEQWIARNKSALDSSNAYVETHGLPLQKHRQF